jgi:lysophospholipase L1-like esterase
VKAAVAAHIKKAAMMATMVNALAMAALLAAPRASPLIDNDNDGIYRISVAGDSNSADGPMGKWRTSWVGWIQKEHLLRHVRVLRVGSGTAGPENVDWSNGSIPGWSCIKARWGANNGQVWVGSSANGHADAIIVAAGTNDLGGPSVTPEQVVECYSGMQSEARQRGIAFFVATTPPVYPPYPDSGAYNERIKTLNALIRSTFDPGAVIDFDSGFSREMFLAAGGQHLNDAGQKLRAERVAAALSAASGNAVPERQSTPGGHSQN